MCVHEGAHERARGDTQMTIKHLTIATTAATITLFTSSLAFAAPPVAYDGWTVTGGVIDTSVSCGGVGVTCKELAPADSGFKYEQVESDGSSFFRLILTDTNATGDPLITSGAGKLEFANENFIPFAIADEGIAQGIASKLVIREAASDFIVTAEVQKGNMRSLYTTAPEEMFTTKLSQSFSSGTDFDSSFSFLNYTAFSTSPATNTPDTNVEIGQRLEITQNVLVGEAGDTTKKQTFVQRKAKGFAGNTVSNPWPGSPPILKTKFMTDDGTGPRYFIRAPITTLGSVALPVAANGRLVAPAATNTITWSPADDIETTWISQSSNSPLNANGTDLAFQRVSNNTTNTQAEITVIELPAATVSPFVWDANFGVAP